MKVFTTYLSSIFFLISITKSYLIFEKAKQNNQMQRIYLLLFGDFFTWNSEKIFFFLWRKSEKL